MEVEDKKKEHEGEFTCDKCGRTFGIHEAGYIGPKDRDDKSCHPMQQFEYVCETCEGSNAYAT